MFILTEDKRNNLIAQGRRGTKEKDGKSRYEKRVKSKVASVIKEFNSIDMQSLFVYDILTINIPVQGETDKYLVRIKFGGVLELIQDQLERQGVDKVDLRIITRALADAFNREDIYMSCNCPDQIHRFQYWSTIKNTNSGPPERRPAKITNPKNDKGPGCKHIMLVLSNNAWLIKVASIINNYIIYMEQNRKKEYADIIYPALYGREYEDDVQLSLDDSDELTSDSATIDKANEEGRTRGQFKAGNPYRYRPSNKPSSDQITIEDESENDSE